MAHVHNRAAYTVRPAHSWISKVMTHLAVWRSRRNLAQLDARALEDIGISADEAKREAQLGLWDVPPNWKGL